jgi:hypothetical protein
MVAHHDWLYVQLTASIIVCLDWCFPKRAKGTPSGFMKTIAKGQMSICELR